jgi:CheY-like chemotaxis protein
LHALAKNPDDRTPSVDELRRDLLIASGSCEEPVRILVAEDDEDFREVLGNALRSEFPEADVVCVGNGRAALDVLAQRSASVAIVDLNMPDLGGFEVTQRLRENELTRTTPIIVLTGSGGPAEWRRLLSLGADKFLVKPVNLEDLVAALRSSVRARSSTEAAPSSRTPPSRQVPASSPLPQVPVDSFAETSPEIVAHESWLLPDDEA